MIVHFHVFKYSLCYYIKVFFFCLKGQVIVFQVGVHWQGTIWKMVTCPFKIGWYGAQYWNRLSISHNIIKMHYLCCEPPKVVSQTKFLWYFFPVQYYDNHHDKKFHIWGLMLHNTKSMKKDMFFLPEFLCIQAAYSICPQLIPQPVSKEIKTFEQFWFEMGFVWM